MSNDTTSTNGIRNIEVFAEASSIENWRKQVLAGQPDAGRFAFISDEGEYLPGGEGFEIALAIESDEPPEQIARLLKMAHQLCFTEHALTSTIPLVQHHTLNGQSINL